MRFSSQIETRFGELISDFCSLTGNHISQHEFNDPSFSYGEPCIFYRKILKDPSTMPPSPAPSMNSATATPTFSVSQDMEQSIQDNIHQIHQKMLEIKDGFRRSRPGTPIMQLSIVEYNQRSGRSSVVGSMPGSPNLQSSFNQNELNASPRFHHTRLSEVVASEDKSNLEDYFMRLYPAAPHLTPVQSPKTEHEDFFGGSGSKSVEFDNKGNLTLKTGEAWTVPQMTLPVPITFLQQNSTPKTSQTTGEEGVSDMQSISTSSISISNTLFTQSDLDTAEGTDTTIASLSPRSKYSELDLDPHDGRRRQTLENDVVDGKECVDQTHDSHDHLGLLTLTVIEAKGLKVKGNGEERPYVLLQYDRTDSVSRAFGYAPPSKPIRNFDLKRKLVARQQPQINSLTTRSVPATPTTTTPTSTTTSTTTREGRPLFKTLASNSPPNHVFIKSPMSTVRTGTTTVRRFDGQGETSRDSSKSTESRSRSSSGLDGSIAPTVSPPITFNMRTKSTTNIRDKSEDSISGTPDSPVWNHCAKFDVVKADRTILLCIYDNMARLNGLPAHGFMGATAFEPDLVALENLVQEQVERDPDIKERGLDIWLPITSVLDPEVGGQVRLRILFEAARVPPPQLSVDQFQVLKQIGRGSFGSVYKVRKKDTKRVYAMKVISKESIRNVSGVTQVMAERQVLAKTHSPFLVGLKFSFQTATNLFFIMDHKGGGELFTHLQRDGGRFDEERVRFYLCEIILAVDFLHTAGIVYRDLKPENCLLDGSGHCVLVDFGLSKVLETPDATTKTMCGTTAFMAPEVLLDVGYSYPADWWSLGCLLFEMCYGWSPFYAESKVDEYERILYAEIKIPTKRGYSLESKDLLLRLLTRDPDQRLGALGATEIQAHPFFTKVDWKQVENLEISAPYKPLLSADEDEYCERGRPGEWMFGPESCGMGVTVCAGAGNEDLNKRECDLFRDFTYVGEHGNRPRRSSWNGMVP